MPPPPIQLFLTTIASQPALRQRQEYILRVLQVKKIPFTSYDLASDEDAKKLWRRKAPADKQQLPGILVGGKFPGTFQDFEDAVEYGELEIFLRRNEEWEDLDEGKPAPAAKPVGVPGAYSPSQMHPKYAPSPSPSPSPLKNKSTTSTNKGKMINAGEHLSEFGLHDVDVTEDDLLALVEELGLGGDDASDLVKGLGGDHGNAKPAEEKKVVPEAKKTETTGLKVEKAPEVPQKEDMEEKSSEVVPQEEEKEEKNAEAERQKVDGQDAKEEKEEDRKEVVKEEFTESKQKEADKAE